MIIVRNKVELKLDQPEIQALENAYIKLDEFSSQLFHAISEDELPVGEKDHLLAMVDDLEDSILDFLEYMNENTEHLKEY